MPSRRRRPPLHARRYGPTAIGRVGSAHHSLHEPGYSRVPAKPGDLHRQQVVAGGHAGAALVDDAVGGVPSSSASNSARRCAACLNVPSAARFSVNGRLSAPGMWPATGSSGSVSPRKRSGARASTSASARRAQARQHLRGAHRRRHAPDRERRGRGRHAVGGRPDAPRASHFAKPPSSTATASMPSQRSIHHKRDAIHAGSLVVGDDLLALRRCPAGRTSRRRPSGVGSGWRPLRPVIGAERSRSRWTKRRRGCGPARYAASPHSSGCARSCRTSTTTTSGRSEPARELSVRERRWASDERRDRVRAPSRCSVVGDLRSRRPCAVPGCSCTAMIPAATISAHADPRRQRQDVRPQHAMPEHAREHDAAVGKRGRDERPALAVRARHRELAACAPSTPTPASMPDVVERHRMPRLRRHPDERSQRARRRRSRTRRAPRARRARTSSRTFQYATAEIAPDARPTTPRPQLVGGERRPQQQHDADETEQHGADELRARPLAREPPRAAARGTPARCS